MHFAESNVSRPPRLRSASAVADSSNSTAPAAQTPPVTSRALQFGAITRATPMSVIGHLINTTIALVAFSSAAPWAPLLLWAVCSYAIGGWVLYRWLARSARRTADRRPRPGPQSVRKNVFYGAILAAPWGILGCWLLGQLPQHAELILIALCVGMSASGSVLLSAAYPAAIAYMAIVLGPVAVKCLVFATGYTSLGALAVSFAIFLLSVIGSCAKLFADKGRALDDLARSLAEAERARREIEHAAMHDALTGLANRRAFLSQEIRIEHGNTGLAALFYIDLDRFKPVNDTFGHEIGDKLLQAVASRLRDAAGPESFIARLGGDEFTLLIFGLKDQPAAERKAAEILELLCAPYAIEGRAITISASIGIAPAQGDAGRDMSRLLKMADLALYKAKEGSGYCCFQQQMLVALNARHQLEEALRRAVRDGQFELFYQPIIEIETLRMTGAEALIRWNHPERGLVSPAEFLQLAEEIHLLHTIEAWVLEQACLQATHWPQELTISVNISPTLVAHTEIAATTAHILSTTGLAPARLELEITESAILTNDPEIQRKLAELKALGVSLAMDDFGTGYSSLSYLSRFPFDRIKIDRSFVQGLRTARGGGSIVRAAAAMARDLGLKTTAEGIETAEQIDELKKFGIEHGQGYFFSSPVSATDLADFYCRWMLSGFRDEAAASRPRPIRQSAAFSAKG